MFGFFIKKKVDLEKVRDYKQAIKAINIFAILNEWNNAYSSISEVKNKEESDYRHLMNEIDNVSGVTADYEKARLTSDYNKKIRELTRLTGNIREKQRKVLAKKEEKRFKIRLKNFEKDFNVLLKTNKNQEAMALLTGFLELNKENPKAIVFYNNKKSIILKNVEKANLVEESKLKKNIKLEALKLIGETVNVDLEEVKAIKEKATNSIFKWFKENFNLIERIKKKRLIDEVSLLVEEESTQKIQLAGEKLERIHKGLIKELTVEKTIGYEFYGKILGADKISGDTFGFNDNQDKNKYNFFLGDATGHGVRAGFIVTLFSVAFKKYFNEDIKKMAYNINNDLKQDLKNRNFITGVLFEIQKNNLSKLDFVGMGHEPIFLYRAKTMQVEVMFAGGLAGGIRLIRDVSDVKVKSISLEDGDVLMIYSDGAVELKNEQGELFGIDKLKQTFLKVVTLESNLKNIYEYIINVIKNFRLGTNFLDDATILLIKRDKNKDILKKEDAYLSSLEGKELLTKRDIKNFVGKTKEEINEEIEKLKEKREIKSVVQQLENLYYTGEVLTLKQEAIRYIKKGLVDKKINYFLKKALSNETKYKISQKQQKIENKYNVLEELFKKGDYETVIKECEDVIVKDGSI